MLLNRTSEWKFMTIWNSRELPFFNFERLVILCARIGHLCEKLWAYEILESFRCSISSVSICDALESNLRVKIYDHLNFSTASLAQFRASRYIMPLNRTNFWKAMTIWISRELPLFNFGCLDILCAQSDIRLKSYDHLKFSRHSVVQLRASWYTIHLNQTPVWKVMTIWNSRELPLFNSEHLNILCAQIGHPCEKLWPFEILLSFHCLILNVSIYYKPESDLRVKSYDHLNFSRASVVQFRASLHVML